MNRSVSLSLGLLVASAATSSAISFYNKDQTGFNNAVAAALLTDLGTEDFESADASVDGTILEINDALEPGVANGPFGSGTLAALGMTIQSNNLGRNPVAPSAHGAFGLAAIGAGAAGTPTNQIGQNQPDHSLDLIFSPGAQAVGLNPTFALDNAVSDPNGIPGSVEIRVYSTANVLLGMDTITGIGYAATDFFGIQAMAGEDIGRINLWASTGEYTGADNINVFGPATSTPNPNPGTDSRGVPDGGTSIVLLGIGLLGLRCGRRFCP